MNVKEPKELTYDIRMKLVTTAQMREIDRETIDNRGIPGQQLMENAGLGIAEYILSDLLEDAKGSKIVVFCGRGNNGGDGYVVGRYLYDAGADVQVYFLGPLDKLSPDAKLNFDRAAGGGLELIEITSATDLPSDLDCDLIVDAIFGTGFSGAPQGVAAEMIELMNLADAGIVSVDMPSGLNADNGCIEGAVVAADYTFTLAQPKFGLYIDSGRELSGTVEVVPIGIPDNVVQSFDIKTNLITPETVAELLPERKTDGHKGDFGRLLILAGSTGMTGAATLTANGANRSGCGLIKLGCPAATQPVLATKLTEVMTVPLPDVAKKGVLAVRSLGEIRALAGLHDALVVGPGIGTHRETAELVRRLLSGLEKPTIIDADGLNNLAGHTELVKNCPADLVLTPHPGEFARLTGQEVPSDWHEKIKVLTRVAADLGAVIVLKGSPTLVADTEGNCWFNQTGNNGMATGGSGDVLSGVIGSFLAQGMPAIEAAVTAVFVHGFAGDLAAEAYSERGMVAGDIIDLLPKTFSLLE